MPVKTYTMANGLAHDQVERIVRDSRGLLWFCTLDGLSRFDGYRFTTYSTKDGLAFSYVNDLIESRRGVYWIATDAGGVSRFDPAARVGNRTRFTTFNLGLDRASIPRSTLWWKITGGTSGPRRRELSFDWILAIQPVPSNESTLASSQIAPRTSWLCSKTRSAISGSPLRPT
ncbi:MAG: hypothetical protein HYS05_10125 [Acidobacteria bacterium]|nr:hypothetical protein [Acidobacteriota bacterium]